jgi:hypothetical protein
VLAEQKRPNHEIGPEKGVFADTKIYVPRWSLVSLRFVSPARPTRPVPSESRVLGSGTMETLPVPPSNLLLKGDVPPKLTLTKYHSASRRDLGVGCEEAGDYRSSTRFGYRPADE